MSKPIYVECQIKGTMDRLWELTQQPEHHEQWDLRFTNIEYLPRPDGSEPQRFIYATRIGFGLRIQGEGETTGEHEESKDRSSALKFWSTDRKSLIETGSGYWKYITQNDGVRFLTRYDYRVRFGVLGRVLDVAIFRPVMHWATAWSFDRLRLWIEKGIAPEVSLERSVVNTVARLSLCFIWVFQGVVPKLLFENADELEMLSDAGVSSSSALTLLRVLGFAEVVFGLTFLVTWGRRWPFLLTVLLMVVATVGVSISSPQFLVSAFNPISLNVAVAALAISGFLVDRNLPSSRNCLLRLPEAVS